MVSLAISTFTSTHRQEEDSRRKLFESHVVDTLFSRLEHCGRHALKETINFVLWISKLGQCGNVHSIWSIMVLQVAEPIWGWTIRSLRSLPRRVYLLAPN